MGELELIQPPSLGSATLVASNEPMPKTLVQCRPLIAILNDLEVDSIGALKFDVEGFEDQALAPFLAEAPRRLLPHTIVMETCHGHLWKSDLLGLLAEKGYRSIKETRGNAILRLP
jgi:hypothetical protein